jgi:DNA-binding transcriptional MerR regulator
VTQRQDNHGSNQDPEVVLTVAAVARRLGVAPATLRTWDRRYGLGPSQHTSGKNRLYSPSDLAKLEQMRALIMQGVLPAKAAEIALQNQPGDASSNVLSFNTKKSVSQERSDTPDSIADENVISLDSPKNIVRGLVRAATMLDSKSSSEIVAHAIDSKGVIWAWSNVLVPALQIVGDKWNETDSGIEVEHLLSEVIESQLRIITGANFEPVNPRPVLLCCTTHELHTLPIYAIAAALATKQIGCRILGARLPIDSLLSAAKKIGPSAILVWSQTRGTEEPTIWNQLQEQRPSLVKIAAGPGWTVQLPDDVKQPSSLTETLEILTAANGL